MHEGKMLGLWSIPPDWAAHGAHIDGLVSFVHVLMLVLFVGWSAFFVYCLLRFKASANPVANYHGVKSHFSSYIEVLVIIVEVIMLAGFSIPLWSEWTDEFPEESQSLLVRVVAERFAWNFHYTGPDGKFGVTSPKMVNVQDNPVGLDIKADAAGKDDIVTKKLFLSVNKPTILHITSKDVIHSFGAPTLRLKQDAIPGMNIPIHFKPIQEGKSLIACSQLCGSNHATMKGFIEIMSQEAFDKWYAAEAEKSVKASSEESF